MVSMGDVPRSELFDDVYFSASGGPEETAHVFFAGNNLPANWADKSHFTIGETGFGTGLNFLLAWQLFDQTAPKHAFLDFVSVEKFPLTAAQIREGLSPWADRLSPYLGQLLERYPINVPGFHRIVFDNRVALTLIFGDANDALPEIVGTVDAWFLDGFTPSKNPDMWTDTVFAEMARLSHAETTFATFTSAGFVKRGLQAAGFTVEKKRGFGRKRDMLAGHYSPLLSPRMREEDIPSNSSPRERGDRGGRVSILGAGLAGTSLAYVLKQYGITPTLYDPNGIASGASGNPTGLINPRFTAFRNAESDFYTAGFAQTLRTLPFLKDIDYNRCGSLHLVTDEDKQKRLSRCAENWGWDTAHMQYLDATTASETTGIAVDKAALYLPDSAQINPSALCHAYAQGINIKKEWTELPGTIICANGIAALENQSFTALPLHTVRGQITFAKATHDLNTNLCYSGYISAPKNGIHTIGSTFQKWLSDTTCNDEDDHDNLEKLSNNVPALDKPEITGHRASLRTASQDRFPVIGELNGAYISTAHGSHGILSTLIGAHIIADLLRGGILCVGKSTLDALSPTRFEKRKAAKAS